MITIAKHKDELGEIKVLKHRAKGSLFYVQGGCYQTETDGYGISLASYIHAIFGLLAQAKARDVLMIGCAGGSLGTMLTKASMPITIVDKNPTSFQIAREYFGLSGTVDCHVADGREFLRASPRRYDAIVLDAYDGDNIPPHLRTLEFLELVELRLDQSRGCLFANIQVMHDLDRAADIYAAAARTHLEQCTSARYTRCDWPQRTRSGGQRSRSSEARSSDASAVGSRRNCVGPRIYGVQGSPFVASPKDRRTQRKLQLARVVNDCLIAAIDAQYAIRNAPFSFSLQLIFPSQPRLRLRERSRAIASSSCGCARRN